MSNSATPLESREKWFLLILFLLALGLRLIYLVEIRSNPFFESPRLDALFHHTWAQSIAAGNFWGDTVFFRAPLYPYFLGLLYKLFGQSFFIPRFVQHLFGAISVLCIYLLARRMFNKTVAVIASILAATYAVLIYFEGELLFESVLVFLCLVWSLLVVHAFRSQRFRWWLFTGIAYGFICITRPTFLALVIPLVAYFIFEHQRGRHNDAHWRIHGKQVSLFLIGIILVVSPITIRNYVVGNDFVLIASQGGINFYIGNNRFADGHSSAIPTALGPFWENREQSFLVEQDLGHKPSPSEESWYWYRKGFEFIIDHPLHFIELTVKKLYLFWNQYEIPNNQSFYSFSRYSDILRVLPIGFWVVGTLGLVGMVLGWKNKCARIFVTFTLLYTLVTIAFFVCDRFRLPVVPFLCIFSAYAVYNAFQLLRERNWGKVSRITVGIAAAAFIVNTDFYGVARANPARDLLSLGMVELQRGEYSKAIKFFEQSKNVQDAVPNLYLTWGVAEWMRGNTYQARNSFHRELQLYEHSYGALSNLSFLYLQQRHFDSSVAYGSQAIRIKPYLPGGYIAVALSYRHTGELTKADSILELGLRVCGNDFLFGEYLLAGSELERGDINRAEFRYRSILKRLHEHTQPLYEPEFQFSQEYKIGENTETLQGKIYYGLGNVFVRRHEVDSAAVYFDHATRIIPEFSDAWANLGVALTHQRKYEKALSSLRQALALNQENHIYWYNYGIVLGNMKRYSEAKEAFEEALRLNPHFFAARQKLNITLKFIQ